MGRGGCRERDAGQRAPSLGMPGAEWMPEMCFCGGGDVFPSMENTLVSELRFADSPYLASR